MQNIIIIGGSRFVGPLLIEKLLARGHKVTVLNRGRIKTAYPRGISFIQGDRNDGFGIRDHFDVVIDMCAYNGRQTETALQELTFDFFVHFGTVAVYRKSETFPLRETSPLGEWPVWGDYNRGKIECEEVLEQSGRRCAVLRPVYISGPKNYADRERFIYAKIKHGAPLTLPGNGRALIQLVAVQDVAESLALLAEKKLEGAFNCAGDDVVTLKGLVEEMANIVGKESVIQYNPHTDGEKFSAQEFPFANENFICSNEKLKSAGIAFTPLSLMLRRDYESYYKNVV